MIAIRPIGPDLFPSATDALVQSFLDDPLFTYIAPDEAQRRRWMPIAQAANLRLCMPDRQSYAAMDQDGLVTGVIGASPPGAYPYPLARNIAFVSRYALQPNPWTPAFPPLAKVLKYVAQWERMHPKFPHWYVFVLGVRPDRQGAGQGKRLLEEILRRAEDDRQPTYLETQTESNVGFYQSLGFEITEKAQPQPDGPPTWGLLKG